MATHSLHQFAAILVVWFAAVGLSSADENAPPFRLPADVAKPVRHALDLTLVRDKARYGSSSQINIHFMKATSSPWLNADKLRVKDASLSIGQKTIPVK